MLASTVSVQLPVRRVAFGSRRIELEAERRDQPRVPGEIGAADRQLARVPAANPERTDAVDLRRGTSASRQAPSSEPANRNAQADAKVGFRNIDEGGNCVPCSWLFEAAGDPEGGFRSLLNVNQTSHPRRVLSRMRAVATPAVSSPWLAHSANQWQPSSLFEHIRLTGPLKVSSPSSSHYEERICAGR